MATFQNDWGQTIARFACKSIFYGEVGMVFYAYGMTENDY